MQNSPTLSVVNDETTSGALDAAGAQRLVDLVVGDVADGLDVDVGVRLLEGVDGRLDGRRPRWARSSRART